MTVGELKNILDALVLQGEGSKEVYLEVGLACGVLESQYKRKADQYFDIPRDSEERVVLRARIQESRKDTI